MMTKLERTIMIEEIANHRAKIELAIKLAEEACDSMEKFIYTRKVEDELKKG